MSDGMDELEATLRACFLAEERRAKRGDCARCGNPPEKHTQIHLGYVGDSELISIGCPPPRMQDYEPASDDSDQPPGLGPDGE